MTKDSTPRSTTTWYLSLVMFSDLRTLEDHILQLVPAVDDLPTHGDAFLYDDEVRVGIRDQFMHALHALDRVKIAENCLRDPPEVAEFFTTFDDELNDRIRQSKIDADIYAERLGLKPLPSVPPSARKHKPSTGRPKIVVDYSTVQYHYWALRADLEAQGERRLRPNSNFVTDSQFMASRLGNQRSNDISRSGSPRD